MSRYDYHSTKLILFFYVLVLFLFFHWQSCAGFFLLRDELTYLLVPFWYLQFGNCAILEKKIPPDSNRAIRIKPWINIPSILSTWLLLKNKIKKKQTLLVECCAPSFLIVSPVMALQGNVMLGSVFLSRLQLWEYQHWDTLWWAYYLRTILT